MSAGFASAATYLAAKLGLGFSGVVLAAASAAVCTASIRRLAGSVSPSPPILRWWSVPIGLVAAFVAGSLSAFPMLFVPVDAQVFSTASWIGMTLLPVLAWGVILLTRGPRPPRMDIILLIASTGAGLWSVIASLSAPLVAYSPFGGVTMTLALAAWPFCVIVSEVAFAVTSPWPSPDDTTASPLRVTGTDSGS